MGIEHLLTVLQNKFERAGWGLLQVTVLNHLYCLTRLHVRNKNKIQVFSPTLYTLSTILGVNTSLLSAEDCSSSPCRTVSLAFTTNQNKIQVFPPRFYNKRTKHQSIWKKIDSESNCDESFTSTTTNQSVPRIQKTSLKRKQKYCNDQ